MDNTEWGHSPEDQFVEKLGRLIEEDGGPRIAGRILGTLFLSARELSLDEIAERLQVSKASVSTNARLLEQLGVVERRAHPGDRRDFYRVGPDTVVRVLERRMAWLRRFGDTLAEGAATPAARDEQVRSRFDTVCGVHRRALRHAERMLRVLRPERRAA